MPTNELTLEILDWFPELLPGRAGQRRWLFRDFRALGCTDGYTSVTDYPCEVRPASPHGVGRRFETAPCVLAQVDFVEFGVAGTIESGGCRKFGLFSLVRVLCNSGWMWGRFCKNQKLETALRCHVMAFAPVARRTGQITTYLLGPITMTICRPSSFGMISTLPARPTVSATRSRTARPRFW